MGHDERRKKKWQGASFERKQRKQRRTNCEEYRFVTILVGLKEDILWEENHLRNILEAKLLVYAWEVKKLTTRRIYKNRQNVKDEHGWYDMNKKSKKIIKMKMRIGKKWKFGQKNFIDTKTYNYS